MTVYSFYYGASKDKGIGIQAQSIELEGMPIRSILKALSSMHALESSDRSGDMLSYLLSDDDGYGILGLSYTESPRNSGYSRSAPCTLLYVGTPVTMTAANVSLGTIVNFVNFTKPDSASPAALDAFPLNQSGYMYHNSVSVLSPLVDGMARAALSSKGDILLVGLPKGKNDYATARYTVSEALNYLPMAVRQKIRFFTGLPVSEGVSDAFKGFDNARQFGANVVFCPAEHYQTLSSGRSCIKLDMNNPTGHTDVFSNYITRSQDVSGDLAQISYHLNGVLTYESLNRAILQMQQSNTVSPLMMAKKLEETIHVNKSLQGKLQAKTNELDNLKKEYDIVVKQKNAWEKKQEQMKKQKIREKITTISLSVLCTLFLGLIIYALWNHWGLFSSKLGITSQPATTQEEIQDKQDEPASLTQMIFVENGNKQTVLFPETAVLLSASNNEALF